MDKKTDDSTQPVAGRVDRKVRPDDLARLRMHADNKTKAAMQRDCEQAADEIERLRIERNSALELLQRCDAGFGAFVMGRRMARKDRDALRHDIQRWIRIVA